MSLVSNFEKTDIIAVDPSLRSTGVYIAAEDYCFTIKTNPEEDRIKTLSDLMRKWTGIFNDGGQLLLIEDYAFSRNSQSVTKLAEVGGIIRAAAGEFNMQIIEVPSTFWKFWTKQSLAPDKKNTKAYCEYFNDKYGRNFNTTDEVDAFLIYKGCCSALETHNAYTSKAAPKCFQKLQKMMFSPEVYFK